jgi:uncharacterized pyridoxal phosphate-containing UPF0001 family protein
MEAYDAGQRILGNKIQEMEVNEQMPKIFSGMIGHVQTNKVKFYLHLLA